MTEAKRLDLFTRLLALGFLASIAVSGSLWFSNRLYPLVPLVPGLGAFPPLLDYGFFAMLLALLASVAMWPRVTKVKIALLALLLLLFLQDQGRLWSSFYEFALFFLVLISIRRDKNRDEEAGRILNVARFILAGVYFWSGFLKFTPNFPTDTFPWFIAPVTAHFPAITPYIPFLAVIAAAAETIFAIGLLTSFSRKLAFWEATAMHLLIFFLIGPLREGWNNSAWIWSCVTCCFLWVLFYKAPPFEWRTLVPRLEAVSGKKYATVSTVIAVLCIGILPALNLINAWPTSLSFNVYTGNFARGQIFITKDTVPRLPAELQKFVVTATPEVYLFDIYGWSATEFNANPVAEKHNFLSLLGRVCAFAPMEAITLTYSEKSGLGIPVKEMSYSCADAMLQ